VDEDWMLGALLGGLPFKYEYTLTSMEERDDITVRKALAMLRAADVRADRFAEDAKKEKRAGTALAAVAEEDQSPRRERYRNTRCHKCNQLGHIQRFCRSGKGTAKTVATLSPVGEEEDEVETAGMATLDLASYDDEPGYAMLAFTTGVAAADEQGCALVAHSAASQGSSEMGQARAVDRRASHHMCGAATDLTNLHQGRGVTITLADGTATRATTRGTAELRVNGTKVTLHDMLLVPGMKMPLFSVRTASRAGFTTEFSDTGVIIRQADSTILQGTTAGGIYVLYAQRAGVRVKALAASVVTPSPPQPTATSADFAAAAPPAGPEEAPTPPTGGQTEEPASSPTTMPKPSGGQGTAAAPQPRGGVDAKAALWHRRYGHLSVDGLSRTLEAVDGMDLTRSSRPTLKGAPCEPCIMGKMVRAPYVVSDREPVRVLMLVHSDLIGPMSVPTTKGRRYMLGAVDDYSRFKVIVPIMDKGQAKDALMRVLNLWESITGERVGTIRTDDGKEFSGPAFDQWMSDKGIKHETSAPYAHQHNGVAERLNRKVQEHMLAVLTEARLDHKYWGEAATAVTRALNCTPQRGQTKTPYELFYGSQPDVSTLRVFGCRAWAYLPPDIRRKMDARALPATHLGYAEESKGYRVLINGRVYVRRDVTFDETTRGTGEPWDAPTGASPEQEVALPAPSEQSPIEEAVAAAQRLVGAAAPPKESAESEAEDGGSGTDAASDDAGTCDTELDGAPVAPPSTDRPASSGDEQGPTRGSLRLQLRGQRMERDRDGAKGLRAWALAASGCGGPDKMRVYEARREEDWPAFDAANRVEVQALWDNGTWDMVPLPQGKKVTLTELLCERKRGADGEIVKK